VPNQARSCARSLRPALLTSDTPWYMRPPMRKPFPGLDADPGADDRVPVRPFLKWAGGKWAVASQIERLLPHDTRERVYREPFLGGGAMFFHLQPHRAFLSTSVADVVTTYEVVQRHVDALVTRLESLRATHSTEQFYRIRAEFNEQRDAPRVERAAWLVYLNKTCFNGLFRTNQSGAFNVPVGRYTNPLIVDPPALRLAAAALARAELTQAHFEHLLAKAEPGDVIYFDPPHVPLSRTSSFSGYADGTFTIDDQNRLAGIFRELDERGCLLALSNSDTPEVRRLYGGFDLSPIFAPRAISAKASTRGEVTELLIRNVARYPGRGGPSSRWRLPPPNPRPR
jgi:DNA adenine methylase